MSARKRKYYFILERKTGDIKRSLGLCSFTSDSKACEAANHLEDRKLYKVVPMVVVRRKR